MRILRELGLGKHSHVVGKTNTRARRRGLARREGGVQRAAARPAPGLGRGQLAHLPAARQPGRAPTPSTRRRAAPTIPGLHVHLAGLGVRCRRAAAQAPALVGSAPKVAVLREQGVNSHVELSYAMAEAGFDTYDVHMTDLQSGRTRLDMFQGFVACGGFSYGDTLGAGEGWARSIRFNAAARRPVRDLLRAPRRRSRSASATAAR